MTWKMPEAGAKGSHIHHRVQEAPRGRLGHAPSGEIAGSTSAARRELGCVARTRSGKCLHTELGAARSAALPSRAGEAGISVVLSVDLHTPFLVQIEGFADCVPGTLRASVCGPKERDTLLRGRRR